MTALMNIAWFLGLIFSILFIYQAIGYSGLTRMFPEGKRPWHFPLQIASLAFFAVIVLYNPWR